MNPLSSQDQALLNDLLDHRLEPDGAAALRARMDAEPALREAYLDLERLRAWGRDYAKATASLEPPADLAAQIRTRIAAEARVLDAAPASAPGSASAGGSGAARPPGARLLRLLTVSYAAAALLIVGFTVRWVLVGPGAEAPERLQETAKVAPEVGRAGQGQSDPLRAAAPGNGDERPAGTWKRAKDKFAGDADPAAGPTAELKGRVGRVATGPAGDALLTDAERAHRETLARILEEEQARARTPAAKGAPEAEAGGKMRPQLGAPAGPMRGPGDSVPPKLRKPSAAGAREPAPRPTSTPVPDPADSRPAPVTDAASKEAASKSAPQAVGIGGGAGIPMTPAGPSAVPARGTSASASSAPETPAGRFKLRLLAAEDMQERVFVLEVGDGEAGLAEARRLLASLEAASAPSRDEAGRAFPTEAGRGSQTEAGRRTSDAKAKKSTDLGGAEPQAAAEEDSDDQPGLIGGVASTRALPEDVRLRYLSAAHVALAERADDAQKAAPAWIYVGSVGRALGVDGLQRLHALAGISESPALRGRSMAGGGAGSVRREKSADGETKDTGTQAESTRGGRAPSVVDRPAAPVRPPPAAEQAPPLPGLPAAPGEAAGRTPVRILILQRK